MDNPNTIAVTLNINVAAVIDRLNLEVSALNLLVQHTDDKRKRDLYYAAMIHIEAAAQMLYRSTKES